MAAIIRKYSINQFNSLIQSIKMSHSLTEEQISATVGYNEGYISQCRSRGEVSSKFIQALMREFGEGGMQQLSTIKDIRAKYGLSQQDLADKTGIPRPRIAKWEEGKGHPKAEDYKTLENFFASLEPATPKDRHINTRNGLKQAGELKRGIMVYESAPVQAGIRTVYHDEHAVPDYVLNIPQFKDCNYGTRASGDSMYPEIRNGDLIVCKELPLDARIIFGDIYVVHTKDGIETIKYVQQFTDGQEGEPWVLLVPHNKAAGMGTPIPRNEIVKLFKVRAIFKAY